MNQTKKLDYLKKFFVISNTTFEFARNLRITLGQKAVKPGKIELLHKSMLEELEKEEPRIDYIDKLLEEMLLITEENKNKNT